MWSLAIVAYEALTGTLPFAGESSADWRRAVLSGTFTPLDKHLYEAPERWQTFFERSFAMDRSRRAQSAAEFFKQLDETFLS